MLTASERSRVLTSSQVWRNPRISGRTVEVDGLRGLAILLVLIFHYFPYYDSNNHPIISFVTKLNRELFWSGVDLFFVLSGYLIAGILIDSQSSPNYFKTFYMRRVHRIIPLYAIWLIALYIGSHSRIDAILGSGIFSSAVPFWVYLVLHAEQRPLALVSRTVAALDGCVVVIGAGRAILSGFAGNRALRQQDSVGDGVRRGCFPLSSLAIRLECNSGALLGARAFATPGRLDALALGVLIALLVRNQSGWKVHLLRHVTALQHHVRSTGGSVTAVGMAYSVPGETCVYTRRNTLSGVLLIVLSGPGSWLAAFCRLPVLQYLSRISYAVYIFHVGIGSLLEAAATHFGFASNFGIYLVRIVSLAVTLLLAELSWRLLESKASFVARTCALQVLVPAG